MKRRKTPNPACWKPHLFASRPFKRGTAALHPQTRPSFKLRARAAARADMLKGSGRFGGASNRDMRCLALASLAVNALQEVQRAGMLVMSPRMDRTALIAQLVSLLEPKVEILESYLFGSRAREDHAAHSDIDVAVYVADDLPRQRGFGYDAELAADIMTELGTNRVDVVILNVAPPLLYHRVLRDGVRLFARDLTATTGREGYALSRYCDYVPQLRKIEAATTARTAKGLFGR
jgi:uncharacterized protein